ncbi:Alpha/Beta hydrolase protein [Xylariomycetidae sp. FL2044]|nr:Alpha/Beta hydrolase protein [Xylariomycetidae sp. FL2044]
MSNPQIKKAYADSPYGQVHYLFIPGSPEKDVLIFLHKSASSSVSYEKLMNHYGSLGHPCYAPDMPGFGGSFDPSAAAIEEITAKGTRWYVDLFIGVFESLGLDSGGFHVIGHHSGASLATEMAAVYPEVVRSICLVGASIMSAEERAKMKEKFFAPFNKPVPDGTHLMKTWDYLRGMGVGDNLDLHHREAIDHIRAWKGRNQIYGAIWDQDKETYYKMVRCPILAMCAEDDVLWSHFENVKKIRDDVPTAVIKGANFSPDRDAEGIISEWSKLMDKSS